MSTQTKTFRDSIADSGGVASPAMVIAAARITNYLVRSGWGDQPASQRAERLLGQVAEREGDQIGDPESSEADLSRLVRMAIALVCKAQSEDAARTVIRPVLNGAMNHAMAVRPIGLFRAAWWSALLSRKPQVA